MLTTQSRRPNSRLETTSPCPMSLSENVCRCTNLSDAPCQFQRKRFTIPSHRTAATCRQSGRHSVSPLTPSRTRERQRWSNEPGHLLRGRRGGISLGNNAGLQSEAERGQSRRCVACRGCGPHGEGDERRHHHDCDVVWCCAGRGWLRG